MAPVLGFMTELLVPLATVAQAGMSIANMAGAFSGGGGGGSSSAAAYAAMERKKRESEADAAEAEEKKRKAYLATLAGGRGGTVLTSGKGLVGGEIIESGLKAKLGA